MSDPAPRLGLAAAVAPMVRVDHAGEYGAVRIYTGQLAVLGRSRQGPLLAHMRAQEEQHLALFAAEVAERRVRPSALLPLWHVAGFALGAVTAALGSRAAMACTVAVEEAIDGHYAGQAAALAGAEPKLEGLIAHCRAEELQHRDIGLANEAEQAPAYRLLYWAIKSGCLLAIALSKRL